MKNVSKITIAFLALCNPIAMAHDENAFKKSLEARVVESCVRGNLSQELIYHIDGNPIALSGKQFPKAKVIKLQQQIDYELFDLIEQAVSKTNSALKIKSPVLKDLNKEYVAELVMNLIEDAPDVFKVDFCGEREHVGSFLYVVSLDYLSRALRMPDGQKVAWLNENKAKLDGLATGVTIVAIYLAAKDEKKLDKFIESLKG